MATNLIRHIILPILLFINISAAYSQNTEREAVIDSMAFGSLDRADLHSIETTTWSIEVASLEYAVFTYARNSLSHYYKDLSDQDLRKVKDLLVSEPYRKLWSISFWDSYKKTFIDKGMAAAGTIPDFPIELNDKEYLAAAVELCRCSDLKQMAVASRDECLAYIGKTFGTSSPSYRTVEKMKQDIEEVLSYVMMDYLSIEDVRYLLDFFTSDLHQQMQKHCPLKDINHFLTSFNSGRMKNRFSRFSNGPYILRSVTHLVPLINEIAENALEEEVVRVLKQIRQVPFPFYGHYRASGSLEMDGGLYVGQMRDGKAYGNGTFTSSDGIMYVGRFKNGYLHGFVKKYDNAHNSINQLWRDGNLITAQIEKTSDDALPPVPMYNGWPHGFGQYQISNTISGGHFEDGRLQGKGFSIERGSSNSWIYSLAPNSISDVYEVVHTGVFEEGVFKKGTIIERHTISFDSKGELVEIENANYVEFKGDVLCERCQVGELINGSDSISGMIIENKLEGEGAIKKELNDSLKIKKTGFFVKGMLYGPGTKEITAIMPSGIKSEQVHTGFFWKDELHKDVVITEKFSGIPVVAGVARIMRSSGVKIVTRGTSELVVECRGQFEEGHLTKGKVTVSDGTWKEGIFKNGEHISGRAKTIDKYGTIYIGDIRDGRYNGKGKCIYADKTYFEGNFIDGVRKDGIYYDAKGLKIRDVK